MEARPPNNEILGLYEWVGKSTTRGNDAAVVDDQVECVLSIYKFGIKAHLVKYYCRSRTRCKPLLHMGEKGSARTGESGGERDNVAQRSASELRGKGENRHLQLPVRLVHISKGRADKHSRIRGATTECAPSR